jgi:hypothetical protein
MAQECSQRSDTHADKLPAGIGPRDCGCRLRKEGSPLKQECRDLLESAAPTNNLGISCIYTLILMTTPSTMDIHVHSELLPIILPQSPLYQSGRTSLRMRLGFAGTPRSNLDQPRARTAKLRIRAHLECNGQCPRTSLIPTSHPFTDPPITGDLHREP